MKWMRFGLPLGLFVVMAIFLLKGLEHDPSHLPSARLDQEIPVFSLGTLIDPSVTVTDGDLRGPLLLNVWATWCPSCRVEHPTLNELSKQGVTIVGLNYKDERPAAIQYLEQYHNPYSLVIFDENGDLGLDLGVYGAPETYFVDAKGIIRHRHVGVVTGQEWEGGLKDIWNSLSVELVSGGTK
ncbi:thiol:disulfide interchange protein [Gammaproteobacteria bacterium 45_16_T64]|nr:thiol:disulfide interchange protein [Gammaproteobacteria bacterium 45_16_T64]